MAHICSAENGADSRSVSANVVRATDPYPFTPGTLPPTASPGAPYQGSFDGPARGIRCARAITEQVRSLGLELRAGLHTGECELVDGKVAGIAVHIGARVAAQAAPGEVLVSSTVKDLVVGSELSFEDRGTHELRGVPGEWRLYALNGA